MLNCFHYEPLRPIAAAPVRMQPNRVPDRAGRGPGHHRDPEDSGRPAGEPTPTGAIRGRLPRRRRRVLVLCHEAPVNTWSCFRNVIPFVSFKKKIPIFFA